MAKKHFEILFLTSILVLLFFGVSFAGPIKHTVGGHAATLSEELLNSLTQIGPPHELTEGKHHN